MRSGIRKRRGRFPSSGRQVTMLSLGGYVPAGVLSNADLERMVNTSDEWIVRRTGIHERRIADATTATSALAAEATRTALRRVGLSPSALDLLIVATTTPDTVLPNTACRLQALLAIPRTWGFDLAAACSGFTFGLATAAQFVATGSHDCVLVVGADIMSRIVDYRDRQSCILFGDGAGAAILRPARKGEPCILAFENEIDGSGAAALCIEGGGSAMPTSYDTVQRGLHYLKLDGPTVFKHAVRGMDHICRKILTRNGYCPADVDLFVPHQANARIIETVAERLGIPRDKLAMNVERYGNTTAASVPLALEEAWLQGRVRHGQLVLLCSVGAGFTLGAALLRWNDAMRDEQ